MTVSEAARWVLLALLGLAIAIGVAIAAANLTSQQIGIASESISAGRTLAPAPRAPADSGGPRSGPPPETTTMPEPTTAPQPPPPAEETTDSDDLGGRGGGDSDGDD